MPDEPDFALSDDIADVVRSASRVIAPLGPIASFAARSPWSGLEDQSFDEVARWLKAVRDVDIYPSAAMLREAMHRGEIDQNKIEQGMQRWLDAQCLHVPREAAERFCRTALELDDVPAALLEAPEVKRLAERLAETSRNFDVLMKRELAVQTLSFRLEQQTGNQAAQELDRHVVKWCKLYLRGASNASWSMPVRELGFYRAWRRLVPYDPALTRSQRQRLQHWPHEAADALQQALSALDIAPQQMQNYLEAHLLSLPGWAGMMLWRVQETPEEASLLMEYLAVRISLEWAILQPNLPIPAPQVDETSLLVRLIAAWAHWGGMPVEAWSACTASEQQARLELAMRFDDLLRRRTWLEAWEETEEERFKTIIAARTSAPQAEAPTAPKAPALAQLAFCIDTRSEPFRRALEQAGPFETFGVAGFFGLPIETCELGSSHSHASLPVMLRPKHKITESASPAAFEQYQQRREAEKSVKHTFHAMKQNMLTSLLLPEVSGPWLSLQMLARSLFPRSAGLIFGRLRDKWLQKPHTELSLDSIPTSSDLPIGFSEREKVDYVRQTLRAMGLTRNFAPLVVICGHGSHTTNNPYAAALDCGACGGASGSFNARVFATLCNQAQVRAALEADEIVIPEDTVFAAAEHNTTLNELRFVYLPKLSAAAQRALDALQAALPKVTEGVNTALRSRLPDLGFGFTNPTRAMQRFAEDWSEVRPEWGLARNAAFLIGTRQRTKGCNLDGRVFLHSYDWRQDHDGEILANIIAGPATVAQWINLQYYASTVAPHYYGSGNKATQTVAAGFGVMQGNASDLMTGLPWQSVMKSDEECYHEPLRLLVIIEAPREHVERLMRQDDAFRQKVEHGWIRLAIIDANGRWETWSQR
ncbi:DUF2309 family protein [Alicyclobacillus cycloheptanicus]|nr:putative inorganic carbon transporter subunit DabA [Alicyclobacillus cycloheptanicus]WDM03021.1 DUF2309 family protein [Alicyclobacillus cycloheptanicus]